MAATLEEIVGFLTKNNLKHRIVEEKNRKYIYTGFRMEHYRDTEGDPNISLVVALDEDGEFFKLLAPRCYSYPDGPHKEALFQACMMVSWLTKMVQFEYDVSDGEVRAIIEFPLEDAPLTEKQFMRCLMAIAQLLDEFDSMIRGAMETGKVIKPGEEPDDEAGIMAAFEEFLRQRKASKPPASSETGDPAQ